MIYLKSQLQHDVSRQIIFWQDVGPGFVHVDFCVDDWVELYPALASIAVKSGVAIIAKATATAANAKTDFVFNVTFISFVANINFILTIDPKIGHNQF